MTPDFRQRFFEIIENGKEGDKASQAYDLLMVVTIFVSIIPLMFVEETYLFHIIEQVTVTIFILDYIWRWSTADLKLKKGGWSFLIYPFTPWAIVDLVSILPAFTMISEGFKLLRIARLLKILRLLRIIRYASQIQVLMHVIKKEKRVLLSVLGISVFYVFITALVMFNAEPRINPVTGTPTFKTFFDALYWATVTLTTVGYGDMVPVTELGRFVSMMSSLFGVAIIALPSGVITASYLDELRAIRKENQRLQEQQQKESEQNNQ